MAKEIFKSFEWVIYEGLVHAVFARIDSANNTWYSICRPNGTGSLNHSDFKTVKQSELKRCKEI